jgi:hypothetical protein
MLEALGLNRLRFGSSHIDFDSDLDGMDNKVRAGGRYYSAKNAVFERNKGFKHLKIFKGNTSVMLAEDFVPFDTQSLPVKSTAMEPELEESWEDEMLRRTREFNKMSRERPHDEKVWLAFAQFQVSLISMVLFRARSFDTESRLGTNPARNAALFCIAKPSIIGNSSGQE